MQPTLPMVHCPAHNQTHPGTHTHKHTHKGMCSRPLEPVRPLTHFILVLPASMLWGLGGSVGHTMYSKTKRGQGSCRVNCLRCWRGVTRSLLQQQPFRRPVGDGSLTVTSTEPLPFTLAWSLRGVTIIETPPGWHETNGYPALRDKLASNQT